MKWYSLKLVNVLKDTYGNTVLHMVVIVEQLGMFGYALKHPIRKVSSPHRSCSISGLLVNISKLP
jgi:hypothetical protein